MNNSFSYLCLHLLLIILDADALKLIPGERSVVKKDGATHTISRYFVVPKGFDAGKANGSQIITAAVSSNSRYAKSMEANQNFTSTANLTSVSVTEESADKKPLNSKRVYSDSSYTLQDVDIRGKPIKNNLVSFSHQLGLGKESGNQVLGNIEVAPINTPLFNNYLKNDSIAIKTNEELDIDAIENLVNRDEEENKFVSADLRVLFDQSSELNMENFWRLFHIYVNKAKKIEQLRRIENLFVLVNIFTNLYKAAMYDIPVDDKIDDIVRILQNVTKDPDTFNNRDAFGVDPIVQQGQGNEYKLSTESNQEDVKPDCLCKRKCQTRMMIDGLDSTSVSVSETDGRMDKFLDTNLQRKESNAEDVNVWVKMPPSFTGKTAQPIKIQNHLVVNPLSRIQNGKPVLDPHGYKVMSLSKGQTQIGRGNGIYDDINLNLNIIDTAEMNKHPFVVQDENRFGLPIVSGEEMINQTPASVNLAEGKQYTDSNLHKNNDNSMQNAIPQITIEGRDNFKSKDPHPPINPEERGSFNQDDIVEDRQGNEVNRFGIGDRNKDFVIEDRQNLPWTIEDRHKPDQPWVIEDRQKGDLPWVIEDRQKENMPWIIEDRQKGNLPWIIEDRQKSNLPWVIEDRQKGNLPWVIEDRQKGNLPWVIEDRQKGNIPWIIEDRQKGEMPWVIEDRQKNNIPWVIKNMQKGNQPWVDGQNMNNLPFAFNEQVRGSKGHEISSLVKPHVYHTYIINPTKILYREADIQNDFLNMLGKRKPSESNLMLLQKPPGTYYESEVSSSGMKQPSFLVNQPSFKSHVKGLVDVPGYDYSTEDAYHHTGLPNSYGSGKMAYATGGDINPSYYSNQPSYESSSVAYATGGDTPTYYSKQPGHGSSAVAYATGGDMNPSYYSNQPSHETSSVAYATSGDIPTYYPKQPGHGSSSVAYATSGDIPKYYSKQPAYESSAVAYATGGDTTPSYYPNQPAYESNVNYGVQKDYSPSAPGVSGESSILYHNSPPTIQGTKLHINKQINTSPMFTDTEIPLHYAVGPPTQSFEKYLQVPNLAIEANNDYQTLPITRPTPSIHASSYAHVQNAPVTSFPSHTVYSEVYEDRPQGPNLQYNTNPSQISYQAHSQQGPAYSNIDRLRAQLSPTYKLFSIDNLLKLQDELLKRKQANILNVNEDRALSNLNMINSILLGAAKYVGSNDLSKIWYENIFLNGRDIQKHPMHFYVYNLIRQKWLHELLLLLHNNNFNLNVLNNPKLLSFLGSWKLPNDISKFLQPNSFGNDQQQSQYQFEETFGAHNVIHDGSDYGPQELIDSQILDDYASENEGLILSITGFDVGLDANGIIDILKKYLLYRNYVEKQENVINRGNKIEMFKQIMLFLKAKGYDSGTIADLIQKLYKAVYRVEEKGCNTSQFNDFAQTAYDVIVPVLRRSAQ